VDGVVHQVRAGQMLFVGAKVEHDFKAQGEVGERLILQLNMAGQAKLKPRVALLPTHPLLQELAMALFTYQGQSYAEQVQELIAAILRETLQQQEAAPNQLFQTQAVLLKSTDPSFRKLLQLIEANPDLDSKTVAQKAGLSPRTLTRLVTAECGLSPHELLTFHRIQRACQLIHEGQLNLAGVAFECGHSSLSQFIANFKKWTGTTPSHYK